MKTIFLESHHIDNRNFGFGQFNYHLIKAISQVDQNDLKFVVHAGDIGSVKEQFGSHFDYKKYFALRRYPAFAIRKKYDLWHSMNQNTKVEPAHKQPYLLTVHDHPNIKDVATYQNQDNHRAFQQKLDRSDAIVYISEFTKRSTEEFYKIPPVKSCVIYNGNNISDSDLKADATPKYVAKRPFLFTIGVMDNRKNFDALVRMMKHLPEYELIISGKNTTKAAENTKKLITELQLSDRVTLTGKITEAEKFFYYRNCEGFVFPSTREGFGLPVVEAMKFGKPVFLSNMTSLPEIGSDVAVYWEDFSPAYMSEIVLQGLRDFNNNKVTFEKRLVDRADSFSWKSAAESYFNLYRELVL